MAAGESTKGGYDEILLAIVERLIQRVEGLTDANCYLSLDPDELVPNPADHVYVVSPVSGSFREGAFVGGGLNYVASESGCTVKIHCPSLTDQRNRDHVALTDEALSVIRKASKVIAALCQTGDSPIPGDPWVPTKDDYGLTSPFRPANYSIWRHPNGAVRSIELAFAFEFDWDVTHQ